MRHYRKLEDDRCVVKRLGGQNAQSNGKIGRETPHTYWQLKNELYKIQVDIEIEDYSL